MSETVAQCIDRVRRIVVGRNRTVLNKLNGAITDTATTVLFDYNLNRITEGGQINVGLETMHVWSVDNTAKSAVVERGQLGSTPVAHSDGDLVEVSPRFTRFAIFNAMIDEIRGWPTSVYRTDAWTMDEASGVDAVEIPPGFGDIYGIIDAYKSPRTGEEKWRRLGGLRLVRDLPTGNLMINLGETTTSDVTYQVLFARPFNLETFALTTDLVEGVGIPESMLDIIAWGAVARLLVPTEVDRLEMDSQGLPRLATEVAQGSSIQLGASFLQIRNQRLVDETYRFIREHPLRFGI